MFWWVSKSNFVHPNYKKLHDRIAMISIEFDQQFCHHLCRQLFYIHRCQLKIWLLCFSFVNFKFLNNGSILRIEEAVAKNWSIKLKKISVMINQCSLYILSVSKIVKSIDDDGTVKKIIKWKDMWAYDHLVRVLDEGFHLTNYQLVIGWP